MPPFGTCFQSKVGARLRTSGGHARHSRAGYLPDQAHCGLACIALARADARPLGRRYFVRLEATWLEWRQQ
jgi:hypothetical protein